MDLGEIPKLIAGQSLMSIGLNATTYQSLLLYSGGFVIMRLTNA